MNAQHTPGPWTVDEISEDNAGQETLGVYSETGYICGVHCSEDAHIDERDCANAHLIAAAPAMYRAGHLSIDIMRQVAQELESLGREDLRGLLRSAIIEQMSALAHAEGSKP